jgi:hypothetical protein
MFISYKELNLCSTSTYKNFRTVVRFVRESFCSEPFRAWFILCLGRFVTGRLKKKMLSIVIYIHCCNNWVLSKLHMTGTMHERAVKKVQIFKE